jgi:peptide/nickel transport system substrate-binding protein
MKRRGTGWRLVTLAALALVSVAALGASAGLSARSAGGTIVDGTTDTVTNIDPAGTYDYGTATLDRNIFENLLTFRNAPTLAPTLATRCVPVKTVKTWRCDLRRGVKFQDGSDFDSTDVKWSFDRTIKLQPIAKGNSPAPLLGNLKSVQPAGKYAVIFNLKTPQATWPYILATQGSVIVPSDTYPADKLLPNDQPQVGTGPYKLVKYTAGQQAVLEPNDDYWGKKPKNDGLIIRYYTKSSTMKLALQRGEVDMAYRTFTPTELASLQTQSGIKVYKGNGSEIRYLVFNVTRAPMNNIAVRKAVAYLMPRQAIAARVYHGNVAPLYSMPPAGLPGHTDAFAALYGRAPSVAKAKAVLKKAGVATPIAIDVWWTPSHYGDASADEYAEIKRGLEQGGVFKVTLKSSEWAQYSHVLGSQYTTFQLGWFPDYPDPENYITSFYATKNFTLNGYSNPKMNALLKAEQGAESTGQRLSIIRRIQTLAAQDVPIVPVWQGKMIVVARNNVHGIPSTLDPAVWLRFWNLTKS